MRALVTGANRGLGSALVHSLVKRGHDVVATSRTYPQPDYCDPAIEWRKLDVSCPDSVARLAASLSGPLDALVNNAAIDARALGHAHEERGPFQLDDQAFLKVMRVNVVGPMLLTQALLPHLRSSQDPVVANISSRKGTISYGGSHGSDIAYNASKAALNMLTARTADLLDSVSVFAVHPGWIATDMGGANATVCVREAADAIVTLLEDPPVRGKYPLFNRDGSIHEF